MLNIKKLFLLLLPLPLAAQQVTTSFPLITNVFNHEITSLNGDWNYIIDPYETGYYDYRYKESAEGFFLNLKPADKTSRIEYDFDKSELIKVPGDWNSQRPEFLYYEGTLWYKRSFDYHLKPGKRLFLYIGASNYVTDVYVNTKKVCRHEGGFTPFNAEISNLVKEKDNFIIIKVDNKRHAEAVPTLNTDWWNYGGITRDVLLVEEDSVFICDYSIGLKKGTHNTIIGAIFLDKDAKEKVNVSIPELKINWNGITNDSGIVRFEIKSNPQLWSTENPKLYSISLKLDKSKNIQDKIGFRTVETDGNNLLINGKPVFLRGICIHEEMPNRVSRANGNDDAKILLGWAKELGCNFVRLAHYPHNEAMTRMADSLGLFVWSEIPVYWTIQWENPYTYQLAENMLADNITRDKNRASIIIWSVGNETPLNEVRLKFMSNLAKKAHQLDNSRLVSAALEVHRDAKYDSVYWVNDPLGEYLDVVSCNEYVGWYDGLPIKTEKITWKTTYNKPFIFSELGAESPYEYHGDSLTRWSVEYQEYFYKQQLKMLKKIPFLTGLSPWILADFRSPKRVLPKVQDGWNKKGLISEKGFKKPAFYILQNWYKEIQELGK